MSEADLKRELPDCPLVSPLSKQEAVRRAYGVHPRGDVAWGELFSGLESAGLVRFTGDE